MTVAHGVRLRAPLVRRRYLPELLITDVDNTLYDFGAYFEAGLEGLVDATSSALAMTEEEILQALKEVYSRHGSIEYPFALEEFPAVARLPLGDRRRVLQTTADAFWAGAGRGLRPYPGVLDALRYLRRDGVDVVAFTDAPIHEAVRRLRALGADRYLSGVVATEWFGRRAHSTAILRLSDVPGFVRVPRRLSVVGRLSKDERKPNPRTYERIMRAFGLEPGNVTVIGDSPSRDLRPAADLGMRPVWARYGRRDPSKERLLQQVVPFRLPEITKRQDGEAAQFLTVDRFDELLRYMPTQQILPIAIG